MQHSNGPCGSRYLPSGFLPNLPKKPPTLSLTDWFAAAASPAGLLSALTGSGFETTSAMVPRAIRTLTPSAISTATSASLITRSEEHTSELQSLMRLSSAVFCWKTTKKYQPYYTTRTPSYAYKHH